MNRPSVKIGGYQCPKCKSMESKVVYTTAYARKKYRERICKSCGHSYVTMEVVIDERAGA